MSKNRSIKSQRWCHLAVALTTVAVAVAAGCSSSSQVDPQASAQAPNACQRPASQAETDAPVAPEAKGNEPTPAAKTYKGLCEQQLADAKAQLAALEALSIEPTVESFLTPFNGLLMVLDSGMNKAALFSAVHPDNSVRAVADSCEQEFSKLSTDIGLSRPLYEAASKLKTEKEPVETQRYVEHILRDFRRDGVDKDEATRTKVRALREKLVEIGQQFGKNVREDVRCVALDPADLAGLPDDYIKAAEHQPRKSDGKVIITTDYPDYIPFMTYAKSDAARLSIYKEFRKRGHPKNFDILKSMLDARYELATALGYKHWAHYITEDKMIKSAEAARTFIEKIAEASKDRAAKDYNELLARLRQETPSAMVVGDWQKSYVQEIVKKEKYAFDSQAVRQYFSYPKVRDGIFELTKKMFGVEYRKVDRGVWHESVEAYELVDGDKVIGKFYLDMHPRADKYKHAAAFPLVTGVSGVQVPEASLVCNFPAEGAMEHDQVETFFHEFGHLIHHLMGGEHRWVGVSGFNTEWDFVEAPSQMLEEWAWDAKTLKTFATNEAGETIPDSLVAAMRKARGFGKGLWVAHQMFYAAVSLNYYDRSPEGLDTTEVMRGLQKQYSPFDYVDDTFFQLSFGHLDGYSAIYYTYMWSLVIAKDMFSVFEDKGLLDEGAAQRYRQYILAPGGSKDADAMVKDFLGRDYTFESFKAWLNRDGA